MTQPGFLDHVWIIGPGRVGLTLASELHSTGRVGRLTVEGRSPQPPAHEVFETGKAGYVVAGAAFQPSPSLVVIAVPDAAIEDVARSLVSRDHGRAPVLHVSGAVDLSALDVARANGISVGSVHPLVAVAGMPGGSRLKGAWFAVEAANERAADAAGTLVEALEGRILPLPTGAKAIYHAATVFASNYLVTLLGVAERLLADAGVPGETAREALTDLARGAVENVAVAGPARALTGPISRGDDRTVEAHLRGLSVRDRALYSTLARATLELARRQGLQPAAADRIARTIETS